MSVSRIQLASVIASGASLAGTCLMQTTIFIQTSRVRACVAKEISIGFVSTAFRRASGIQANALLKAGSTKTKPRFQTRGLAGIPALEQQRGVRASEAEGIRQRVLHGRL